MSETILAVEHLNVWYGRNSLLGRARRTQVLHDVSFSIRRGEILGLVGESGCGKSTLAKAVLGIEKDISGVITHASQHPQMIFQNPFGSLNPAKTVEWIVEEPLRVGTRLRKELRHERVMTLLNQVGLSADYAWRYPRELSGGQRQRVAIAAALIQQPKLIFADEPVSALDVTVQAQILELLFQVRKEYGLSYLFISHDLNVIYQICDRVMVMKDGVIVESGPVQQVYDHPQHPYTQHLLSV